MSNPRPAAATQQTADAGTAAPDSAAAGTAAPDSAAAADTMENDKDLEEADDQDIEPDMHQDTVDTAWEDSAGTMDYDALGSQAAAERMSYSQRMEGMEGTGRQDSG